MTDPIGIFHDDRARARQAEDPMAALCTVANIDADQQPQLRTLVLREVDGALAIFVNATSPKWQALTAGFAMHTYWPSINIQYRFQVQAAHVDPNLVADSWQLRPDVPKRMDWYYENHAPQSAPVSSRDDLLTNLTTMNLAEPLQAPENARGLIMEPQRIERLDLNQPDGVHERTLFILSATGWQRETLVP